VSRKQIPRPFERWSKKARLSRALVIDAVENPPDPDVAQITTGEVPEDGVPSEYLAYI